MTTVEELSLRWDIPRTGSARLYLSVRGSDEIFIRTSYIGDGLASILRAAIDIQLGSSSSFAVLLGEPGGYRIFLSNAADEVYVQIVGFQDLQSKVDSWKGGELKWEAHVLVDELIQAIIRMAESVLEEYGEAGYLRLWGGIPFPAERLSVLRHFQDGVVRNSDS